MAAGSVSAQLQIATLNSEVLVGFEATLSGVNEGPFVAAGIVASPSAGQLDSNAWRITGVRPADTTFGGNHTDANFTRGFSTGGVTTGGLYAFDVGGGNRTLGIQPTGLDFTGGTITLRIQNNTGSTVNAWDLSYDLFVLNDQNRSNSFDWAWSTDDITYTTLSTYSSTGLADEAPVAWENVISAAVTNLSASVADEGYLYLQWLGNDAGGSGGRDEFAIDNISVTAVPEPSAAALLLGLASLLVIARRRR